MRDISKPSLTLLLKIGSMVVHAEELLSPGGHAFDKAAFDALAKDPEVVEWMTDMTRLGYIPKKRTDVRR
jgi:hypothetical protein